ncbi:hypothetical protein KM1_170450 [Entamoeba histolytica HM-3:IMSS]|uniref:Single tm domain protein n=2 Tax=Entamoeba histolytica TaxID=5759 RepID=A0A175JWH3_ENTHI|nr:hypothetical protein KM1_170450 [Entamoeba histolytica HM-3:IMSS]GAT98111.1 single tm domain protein [Entamoeba histolytica]
MSNYYNKEEAEMVKQNVQQTTEESYKAVQRNGEVVNSLEVTASDQREQAHEMKVSSSEVKFTMKKRTKMIIIGSIIGGIILAIVIIILIIVIIVVA